MLQTAKNQGFWTVWGGICKKNKEALEYFHFGEYAAQLHSIGGKMLCRDIVGNLRFDEKIISGEDTLFIYKLLLRGADVVFLQNDGYYYRKRENSSGAKCSVKTCKSRYKVCKYICSCETERRRKEYAKKWKTFIIGCIINWYIEGEEQRNILLKIYLKRLANIERKGALFSEVDSFTRGKMSKILYHQGIEE